MTIARGQMKRQLYQDGTMPEGGLPSLEDIMEGKVSPAEMALIRETLEVTNYFQNYSILISLEIMIDGELIITLL